MIRSVIYHTFNEPDSRDDRIGNAAHCDFRGESERERAELQMRREIRRRRIILPPAKSFGAPAGVEL